MICFVSYNGGNFKFILYQKNEFIEIFFLYDNIFFVFLSLDHTDLRFDTFVDTFQKVSKKSVEFFKHQSVEFDTKSVQKKVWYIVVLMCVVILKYI